MQARTEKLLLIWGHYESIKRFMRKISNVSQSGHCAPISRLTCISHGVLCCLQHVSGRIGDKSLTSWARAMRNEEIYEEDSSSSRSDCLDFCWVSFHPDWCCSESFLSPNRSGQLCCPCQYLHQHWRRDRSRRGSRIHSAACKFSHGYWHNLPTN